MVVVTSRPGDVRPLSILKIVRLFICRSTLLATTTVLVLLVVRRLYTAVSILLVFSLSPHRSILLDTRTHEHAGLQCLKTSREIIARAADMVWRFLETQDVPPEYTWWWWTFYMVEVFLLFAIWLGHSQRLFAVQRVRTTMDQIVSVRGVGCA